MSGGIGDNFSDKR